MKKEKAKGAERATLRELSQLRDLMGEVEALELRIAVCTERGAQEWMQRQLENRLCDVEREKKKLMRYIQSIEDSRLRQIFELRFLLGKSWEAVAATMGISSSAAVMAVRRYIERKK